jgi:hypothetical protein
MHAGIDLTGQNLVGKDLMWKGAEAVWNRLMNNVATFVNENGGHAIVNPRISRRIDWKDDFLKVSGVKYKP